MNNVRIFSRQDIEETPACPEAHAYIAIRDVISKMVRLSVTPKTMGVLRLQFTDISTEEHFDFIKAHVDADTSHIRLFTKENANQIIDFYLRTKDKIQILIVSCEAGISRSSAVALFLCRVSGLDTRWITDNMRYSPNTLVLKLLEEVWKERIQDGTGGSKQH